jgi:hypothetical protein
MLRPPLPLAAPLKFTVVSPPDNNKAGGRTGLPWAAVHAALLRSGATIEEMNIVRQSFIRHQGVSFGGCGLSRPPEEATVLHMTPPGVQCYLYSLSIFRAKLSDNVKP